MSMSIQTNVASMVAQDNLQTNTNFQTNTIEQLTSGYRINNAGDDAAGLTVANQYRSNIAELTQGVLNANNGVSALQIMDGGLSNISTMLDRLNTLATESASSTFTGDRNTLNTEYQSLTQEIDRQAQNIQLNQGGTNNTLLSVLIGGATQAAGTNAAVNVDLSGQAVDSASLGLANTSVAGGGNQVNVAAQKNLSDGATVINNVAAPALTAPLLVGAAATQVFTVNYTNSSGTASTQTVTVKGTATGITTDNALSQINNQLSGLGISASLNGTTGALQFSGSGAFSVTTTATTADSLTNEVAAKVDNQSLYTATSTIAGSAATPAGTISSPIGETFSLVGANNQTVQMTLGADTTLGAAVTDINTQAQALGITASITSAGKIQLSSTSAFTMVQTAAATTSANDLFGGTVGNVAVAAPSAATSSTGNALSALTAIQNAVQLLGTVQGKVGAGENTLQYAIDLANSQITNFSSAESNIRDANVATEAANLTKAQVLQQSSIAAMAQANSAPQALLKLLQ